MPQRFRERSGAPGHAAEGEGQCRFVSGRGGLLELIASVTGWHGVTRTVLGAMVSVWFLMAIIVWLWRRAKDGRRKR
jgi:hypothetical protein